MERSSDPNYNNLIRIIDKGKGFKHSNEREEEESFRRSFKFKARPENNEARLKEKKR